MDAAGSRPNGPRMMKASEFKAKCLKLMDEVAENGEEIVITKNGNPTARLVRIGNGPRTGLGRIGTSCRFLATSSLPSMWSGKPSQTLTG